MAEKLSSLTEKERKYFAIMWAKYGVLNIISKPGVAKSAIGKSIADKMGFNYVDIRLSMIDETDVGLYPSVTEVEVDGKMVKCLDFIIPRWAVNANQRPTIIHFEELEKLNLPQLHSI
jgi:MoxR-like ATPase